MKSSLERLLGALAICVGKDCRIRPAVRLTLRDCSSAAVAGGSVPQEATFYVRGRKIGRDARPPLRIRLRHASSGAWLQAVVTALDGRTVTLKQKLPRC